MSPFRRLWNTLRVARVEDDLRQELDTHLALIEEEEHAQGSTAEEARLKAIARFGSPLAHREKAVDAVVVPQLERVRKEAVFAARRLRRSPAFTIATVLTLALAIGANVSIFAVVYRVVLNPLPYDDSNRLLALTLGRPDRKISSGISLPAQLYFEYLDNAHTLDGIAAYRTGDVTLTGLGPPERFRVVRTTPSLATVLRVRPERGRWFTEEEGLPGALPVAVLSHGLWQRRYGGDPTIVGKPVVLDGVLTSIVGVMPASFAFPDPRFDLLVPDPLSRAAAASPAMAGVYDRSAIARLRQGVTVAETNSELTRLAMELGRSDSRLGYDKVASAAALLIDATVGGVSRTLWTLFASVTLVLLVACANVANLFLVRSDANQREVAIRRALGAGAGGIAGYFFAESASLAAFGGAFGLFLAWAAIRLLVALGPASLPRLHEVGLDAVAVVFTIVLTLATGVALGALCFVRLGPLAVSLHESNRGSTTSRSRHRARHALMAGQIALGLVLLVSSGLLFVSLQKLRAVDPGFTRASALTFRLGLSPVDYPDRPKAVAAHRAILGRLSGLPGVTAVSATTCLPLSEQGCFSGPLFLEGWTLPPSTTLPQVRFMAVADRYFETMGTRVVRGRGIQRNDVEGNEPVVVVNEALVNVAFENQDPLGRRIRMSNPGASPDPGWLTVVGVVANTSYRALAEPSAVPMMYMPMVARPAFSISPPVSALSYVVRTVMPPQDLTRVVHGAVASVNGNLALAQVATLEELFDRASAQMAFTAILLTIAALTALLLGVIGIYGAMSYIVSRRTGEIGVRLALGAKPERVLAMIVRQGAIVALMGISAGLAVTLIAGRLTESLLYGVHPRDPAILAAVTLILFIATLAASWVPARRAARISPMEAVRTE